MCTSFVVKGDRTWIGMNFDISARPIKLVYQKDSQLLVMQEEQGQYLPAFGINQKGTFMNLHMVEANAAGAYRRGKDCVHIMRLFEDVMGEKLAPGEVTSFVNDHLIVNVPGHSVQSLVAGTEVACVVQPGRQVIEITSSDRQTLVLTNFSLSDAKEKDSPVSDAPGADRYRIVSERLASLQTVLDVETSFSILEDAVQQGGDFPTQLSLVVLPEERLVHFALHGNFAKTYCFSFDDRHIRTTKGFFSPKECILPRKGLLISELAGW